MSKDRLASQFQVACGWAFDLGREEAQRADDAARVRLDWWLEHEKHLADVSSKAMVEEILARCAKAPAVRRAIIRRLEELPMPDGATLPTLLDMLKANALVATGHTVTSRRSMPAPVWRRFNEGVSR